MQQVQRHRKRDLSGLWGRRLEVLLLPFQQRYRQFWSYSLPSLRYDRLGQGELVPVLWHWLG